MPMTPMTRISLLAAAATVVIVGPGIATAAADDYSGQTYGDATAKLSDAGKKAVITSRSGDSLPQAKCVVTHSQSAPWLKGEAFTPVTNTVLLDLNCNATVASATTPGNSAASPEGRKALKEAAAKKKRLRRQVMLSGQVMRHTSEASTCRRTRSLPIPGPRG
jgi:hypothetical protein